MDNASKNAKDMIGSLQMKYNRGRQAAITNELVDIITGKFKILLFGYPIFRITVYFFKPTFALQLLLNWGFWLTCFSFLQVQVLFERSAYIINTENRCLGPYTS